jgi:ABC-type sugar transport system substrate-binding protein
VHPSQHGVGQIQAEQALRLLGGSGFLILVTGAALSPAAVGRKEGFFAAVGQRLEVQELDGRWTSDGAERALTQWFQFRPDRVPQLVVCHNDAMARGAQAALKKEAARSGRRELERVPLLGCDGVEDEGLTQVNQHMQAATIILPPTTRAALHALAEFWTRGVHAPVTEVAAKSFPALEQIAAATGPAR